MADKESSTENQCEPDTSEGPGFIGMIIIICFIILIFGVGLVYEEQNRPILDEEVQEVQDVDALYESELIKPL